MNFTAWNWCRWKAGITVGIAAFLAGGVNLWSIPVLHAFPVIAQDIKAADESKTDPIAQKLIGKWETVRPPVAEVDTATFAFAPNGKLFVLMSGASGESAVVQMEYQIDPKPQPMHLNLILPNRPDELVRTIFGFTDEGLLRLQISGTDPTTPRPSDFTSNDPPLRKISNDPSLQPDVKAVAQQMAGRNRESEGKLYVNSLIQAEFAYFLANGKYAISVDQLGTEFQPETENYRYEIVADEAMQWVGVRGVAKRLGLKSFVGIVFTATEQSGPFTLMAAICQTKEPTRLPPRLPDLVTTDSGAEPRIRCRAETQPIR